MKLVPGPLPPLPTGATMDRLPLPLPFSPDLLWRYPLGFPTTPQPQGPNSPLMDFKTHLPTALASDPRLWSRDDVVTFLKWSEREFDLQPFDLDTFQMNGKALCLLTRNDFSERSPGSGDVLHNVLQILIRDATLLQHCLPSSPVTPTSRHAYPLSPHSHPSTPNWNILAQNSEFHPNPAAIAAHLMAHSNSVTLSPAPSVDSQAGSPQHAYSNQTTYVHSIFGSGQSNGSGSNQSDSDEDNYQAGSPHNVKPSLSPPNTPGIHGENFPVSQNQLPRSPKREIKSEAFTPAAREFFPSESPEPNTNGRLLWDFLQQLLNDPTQRFTNYIAWKNRDTGVFKIVDPAGLAKLWGIQKNHLSMNYDKMSRALRYYYRVNILRKVQGERHCYQFLRNPTELKNIKNISLLRQQMSPTRLNAPTQILQSSNSSVSISFKAEPVANAMEHSQIAETAEQEEEEKPTDLSIIHHPADLSISHQPTDLSSAARQSVKNEESNNENQFHIVFKQDVDGDN